MRRLTRSIFYASAACMAFAQTAMAHPGHPLQTGTSLSNGFLHPLLGLDHLLAALASGLLAVRIGGRRALWLVPASFVALMFAGGALAAAEVSIPQAEWGITLSVLVLGLAVAMTPRLPLAAGVALIGLFAICHGHAHVAELGGNVLPAYLTGLALGTLLIQLAGIGLGLWAMRIERPVLIRLAGAAISCGFLFLLLGH